MNTHEIRDLSELSGDLYRHFSRLYGYAIYHLQNPNDADDVVAKTFVEALASYKRFDPALGSLETWLLAIERNIIRKQIRARTIQRCISLEALLNPPATPLRWVEDVADSNNLLRELLPLIRKLPERDRDVLSLKFGAEATNRTIAEILNLTESNVGVILYRTLRRLRDQIKESSDDGR